MPNNLVDKRFISTRRQQEHMWISIQKELKDVRQKVLNAQAKLSRLRKEKGILLDKRDELLYEIGGLKGLNNLGITAYAETIEED